ncbi:MAG: carboxypeptidase regulatory-like domain-containing protein [Acidobacteria bacterium]|nr:carboxypeptidase regulatory-like domain-containing protein [Acidobacteriota bacterium]
MRRSAWVLVVVAAFLLIGPQYAMAQNAQVTGSAKDQSGGVVPGATVTAKNTETGLVRTATSDATGKYRLPALPPGTYTVAIELQGFNPETRPGILLVIDQTASIDFTLKPASIAESVTVTTESPIVDTTVSTVSTSVSNAQIQSLPVASRRWIDLAMLTPGTSQDNIRGTFYRGNVNVGAGTREYSNGFVVDGVNNTWAEMGEPRQNFAMDSIREFKVSTSNYKAEYGLATGGMVTVVSKSGTNQLHGSGLVFFRDKSLTSTAYFEQLQDGSNGPKVTSTNGKPDFRRFQYGGTFGGPIIKNKTHFFVAYEGTQEKQYMTVYTGGIWPGEDRSYLSKQTRWTYTAKIDHQLSSTQSLFLRVAQENEYRPIITAGGRTTPSAAYDFAVPRDSAVLGHTWVMGARALNDFRFQYAFSKYEVAPPYSHGSWAPADFTARLPLCTPVYSYPSITFGGCGNAQMGPETRWEIKDDFSYLLASGGGRHQLKAGFDASWIPFEADNMGSPYGSWTFPKDKVYDPNDSTTWPSSYTNTLPTYANILTKHISVYVQDDWSARNGLTFNLGLRYDRQIGSFNEDLPGLLGKIADKLGPGFGYTVPISPWQDGWQKRGDFNNFGPRVGVAWDPTGNGETNVHAGYGMFYDNMRTLNNFGELTWPQGKTINIQKPSFPDPFQGKSRDAFLSTAPATITVYDNKTPNPFAHQFDVGFTRMLGRDIGVTADLLMVYRYSDQETIDANLPATPFVTTSKPYPQYNRVNYRVPTADNTYKAFLLKVDKRMNHRYQYMVSYTLSKAEDINSTSSLADRYGYVKLARAGSADRRHRLVVSGVVQLPLDVQLSAIGDFRSSLPFSPSSSYDLNGDGYSSDLPAGVLPGSGCRSLNLDAINAFRATKGLAAVSADTISCAQYANVDLRLSKFFTFGASHRVEVIAQLFNVLNRANFGTATGSITSALFGQPTGMAGNINAPSRQVELALRYQF